ncbi:hypothetical protein Forpe1208_v002449 [Fusarium oxysporum f. sp. rapae]|uniref:Uncharacterized protein n=1 Tax=Fusarium oxysporum f. sp. rapae TaxID=485398 RepID=A0A8J5P528_FUSOX|nr:hypothetical protein Forpe1208_v002449 [Fusarium oxysporum f. sp. rapae]
MHQRFSARTYDDLPRDARSHHYSVACRDDVIPNFRTVALFEVIRGNTVATIIAEQVLMHKEDKHKEDKHKEDKHKEDKHKEDKHKEDKHREDKHQDLITDARMHDVIPRYVETRLVKNLDPGKCNISSIMGPRYAMPRLLPTLENTLRRKQ